MTFELSPEEAERFIKETCTKYNIKECGNCPFYAYNCSSEAARDKIIKILVKLVVVK